MKRAASLLPLCLALVPGCAVVQTGSTASAEMAREMPNLEGQWRYEKGGGNARVAIVGGKTLEIRLDEQERKARGEADPHFRIFGEVQRDFGRWAFTGHWECNTRHQMAGCTRYCRDGPITAVIESEQRIRLKEVSNECTHNLSGLVLVR